MSEIQQLIKMANQIAANFSFHEDSAARVADHLARFWAPQMRKKLAAHIADGGDEAVPAVVEALARLDV